MLFLRIFDGYFFRSTFRHASLFSSTEVILPDVGLIFVTLVLYDGAVEYKKQADMWDNFFRREQYTGIPKRR